MPVADFTFIILVGLDVTAHPENISKKALWLDLVEPQPGNMDPKYIPTAFGLSTVLTVDRDWATTERNGKKIIPLDAMDVCNAYDMIRAKQDGCAGSALILWRIDRSFATMRTTPILIGLIGRII